METPAMSPWPSRLETVFNPSNWQTPQWSSVSSLFNAEMPSIKNLLTCSLSLFGSVYGGPARREDQTSSASCNGPLVTVKNGTYRGVHSAEYNQDFFLGMRYAQPAQRFQLSEPLNSTWDGAASAKAYPPHCVGYGGDMIGYNVSEDCLFLNVIRPAGIDSTADLPVAVWIHGGGLYMGGSADKRYNLSFIVQNSVEQGTPMIGVSLNYRLSAFGFLCGSEALDAGITNNGFRDQRLALRWVSENIAAFGGSPDKITIFGESSGAESVSAQVLAYNGRDDGLFRGAMAESGFGGAIGRFPGGFNNTAAQQAVYDLLVTNTSCAGTVGSSASLDCLRDLPFEEINLALNGTSASPWPPVLDGDFIADFPHNQLVNGKFPRIPILIGANTDEGTAFGSGRGPNGTGVNTDDDMRYAIENIIGPDAAEETGRSVDELVTELMYVYPNIQAIGIPSLDKWPVILPGDAVATSSGLQYRRTGALFGDFSMHYSRRRSNIAWSYAGLPSYSFRFDVVVNGIPGYVGATHFQEVAFVFYNLNGDGYDTNPFANESAAYPALAKTISSAWINFVTGLDPNGQDGLDLPGGATWPVYNVTDGGGVGKEIVFDVNGSYVEMDSWHAEGINWMIENSLPVFGS